MHTKTMNILVGSNYNCVSTSLSHASPYSKAMYKILNGRRKTSFAVFLPSSLLLNHQRGIHHLSYIQVHEESKEMLFTTVPNRWTRCSLNLSIRPSFSHSSSCLVSPYNNSIPVGDAGDWNHPDSGLPVLSDKLIWTTLATIPLHLYNPFYITRSRGLYSVAWKWTFQLNTLPLPPMYSLGIDFPSAMTAAQTKRD